MSRTYEVEEYEHWSIHVECSEAETPYVAAHLPKMIAGFSGSYAPDVYHVHQQLPAPEATPQLSYSPQASFSRNGSYSHARS